jgi:hypothetical protein
MRRASTGENFEVVKHRTAHAASASAGTSVDASDSAFFLFDNFFRRTRDFIFPAVFALERALQSHGGV